jgi:hyperosmotically inducible protein
MKTRIVALACALTAAACADMPPAQDPASGPSAAPSESRATVSVSAPVVTPPNATLVGTSTSSSTSMTDQESLRARATVSSNEGTSTVLNNPGVADHSMNADNTKTNDRDRHGALTPMDQGNSGSETKITATIRKGIMADSTLSFTAKNVKVITVGSKVTLRGPVNSDPEKASIAALAKQTAGVSEVDNQLEVKK